MPYKIWCVFLFSLLSLYAGGVFADDSIEASNNTIAIVKEDEPFKSNVLSDFSSCLQMLTKGSAVTIICEGVPVHAKLTPAQTQKLIEHLKATPRTTEETVADIAAAYDYETEWENPHLCLWNKRFSTGDDFPELTIEEASRCLNNIRILYGEYRTPINSADAGIKFIKLLDPKMRELLEENDKPISALPPSIKSAFYNVVTTVMPGRSLRSLESIANRLRVCSTKEISLQTEMFLDVPLPVYAGPFRVVQGRADWDSIAVSSVVYGGPGGGSVPNLPRDVQGGPNPKEAGATYIKSDPILYKFKDCSLPVSETVTIGQAVEALRLSWKSNIPLSANPAIAAKRISWFNTEANASEAVAAGIARIYGLRYARTQPSKDAPIEWMITTYPAARPRIGEDFSEKVKQQIPRPLYRSIVNVVSKQTPNQSATTWTPERQQRMREMYAASMAKFRELADKELAKADSGKVLFSMLEEASRKESLNYIAVTSMLTLMPDLMMLSQSVAPFLVHFEGAVPRIKIQPRPAENGNSARTYLNFSVEYNSGTAKSGIAVSVGIPQNNLE